MRPTYEEIVRLTDAFCAEHLDDEYAQLCRKLAAALARKRPSPLSQGKIETWACAVTYTIGRVNFLFDKSQSPHMSAGDLCAWFGVSKSTAAAKAKGIMDTFRVTLLDPHWSLPSKIAENPLAWIVMVNGFPIDVRDAPREIQEEALRRGIIPYIPELS